MKIGFSYSRCVRDIVDGVVEIQDVLVIIARTDFDPRDDQQWAGIWAGYGGSTTGDTLQNMFSRSFPEWSGYDDQQRFREVSVALWEQGKLHQPRKFGAHPPRSQHVWVDTGPIGVEHQPQAVQDAWQAYVMLSSLSKKPETRLHDDF